jgi:glutathione synthase/RimK-type ligase-like ATP-grasp enzyme
MKKVLIVGRQNVGEKNDAKLLAGGIAKHSKDRTVESVYYEDILFFCSNGKVEVKAFINGSWREIVDFDLIILINWSHDKLYSDLAHVIATYAHSQSSEVWNTELINARRMTKISHLKTAVDNNIRIPSTLFSFSKEHLLNTYDKFLAFPLIMKDPIASRGRRNFLIKNKEELRQHLTEGYPVVLQEYIKNDSSDIRIIVAGGVPVFAFKRTGKAGSHLNNISAGGRAEKINIEKIPKQLIELSKKLSNIFKKELCGVDFMLDTSKSEFIFLEINTTPQLVNGIYAEEKLEALAKAIEQDQKG